MAYVIAEPCISAKDTECVDACPVDAIHPHKGEAEFASAVQLYIDPETCICCGACVPVCPVGAIYAEEDLPEKWKHFARINADRYRNLPIPASRYNQSVSPSHDSDTVWKNGTDLPGEDEEGSHAHA